MGYKSARGSGKREHRHVQAESWFPSKHSKSERFFSIPFRASCNSGYRAVLGLDAHTHWVNQFACMMLLHWCAHTLHTTKVMNTQSTFMHKSRRKFDTHFDHVANFSGSLVEKQLEWSSLPACSKNRIWRVNIMKNKFVNEICGRRDLRHTQMVV